MLQNVWLIASIWMGLALIASLTSIRTGISVALIEILVGVVAGNLAVGLEGGTLYVSIASAGLSAGHLHHVLQSTEHKNSFRLEGVISLRGFPSLDWEGKLHCLTQTLLNAHFWSSKRS